MNIDLHKSIVDAGADLALGCGASPAFYAGARRIYVLQGGDVATKTFQKSLRTFTVSAEDLEKFSDEQLIELFEVVVRRYNERM